MLSSPLLRKCTPCKKSNKSVKGCCRNSAQSARCQGQDPSHLNGRTLFRSRYPCKHKMCNQISIYCKTRKSMKNILCRHCNCYRIGRGRCQGPLKGSPENNSVIEPQLNRELQLASETMITRPSDIELLTQTQLHSPDSSRHVSFSVVHIKKDEPMRTERARDARRIIVEHISSAE